MSSETGELLPCPFCGLDATKVIIKGVHMVRCRNDECVVNPATSDLNLHDAIEQWNTRAQPQADGEAVAWLRREAAKMGDGDNVVYSTRNVVNIIETLATRLSLARPTPTDGETWRDLLRRCCDVLGEGRSGHIAGSKYDEEWDKQREYLFADIREALARPTPTETVCDQVQAGAAAIACIRRLAQVNINNPDQRELAADDILATLQKIEAAEPSVCDQTRGEDK